MFESKEWLQELRAWLESTLSETVTAQSATMLVTHRRILSMSLAEFFLFLLVDGKAK